MTTTEILAIKKWVRARDGYRCQGCGMTDADHFEKYRKSLHVHRVVPGSIYTKRGCVTLCYRCHAKKHWKPYEGKLVLLFNEAECLAIRRAASDADVSCRELVLRIVNKALCAEVLSAKKEIVLARQYLAEEKAKGKGKAGEK